ncbi:hypothetical protein [Acidithiobacillus ferrianus]|uniref:hypothetical protein n=1 Tax=Acidithiobacillus ferrianus TaxID=2678518 RepID=UPI0034E55C08
MDIEAFLRQHWLGTWEHACSNYDGSTWFAGLLYHIWQSVDSVKVDSKGSPVTRSEKKALMLAIIDRLLSEGRIVFDDPNIPYKPFNFTVWHVDRSVILKHLNDHWPDMADPDYDDKMISYLLDHNEIAWIDRKGETNDEGRPGSLWADGGKLFDPGEWS